VLFSDKKPPERQPTIPDEKGLTIVQPVSKKDEK